jgi:Sec-independent protein secretion pathway component TatC
VNQTLLALPMLGLYLLGVLVAWMFGRARKKPAAEPAAAVSRSD